MPSAPIVHNLETLDAEPLCDLRSTDQLIHIQSPTHRTTIAQSAYRLTQSVLRISIRSTTKWPRRCVNTPGPGQNP